MAEWKFYGRSEQLADLERMLQRKRWFFAKVTGRMTKYESWNKQFVGISVTLDATQRSFLTSHDIIPQDLHDLTLGLN